MEILRQLGIRIDVLGNTNGLNKMDSSLNGLIGKAQAFAGVLAGAFALRGLSDFVVGNLKFGDELSDNAAKLGVSVESLQKWSYVAEIAGSDAGKMSKAVAYLNTKIGEMQLGLTESKTLALAFKSIGLDSKGFKSADEALFAIADKLKALPNDYQRFAVASQIFGAKAAKDLVKALSKGSVALKEHIGLLEDMGGILDQDAANAADHFGDRMVLLGKSWQVAKSKLVATLLPALETLLDVLFKGIKLFTDFDKATGIGKVALYSFGVAAALVGLSSLAAFWPLLLAVAGIAAAVTAAYLIFDDLAVFFKGKGKSATEEFIKSLLGAENGQAVVDSLRNGFKDLVAFITDAVSSIDRFINRLGNPLIGAFLGVVGGGLVGGPLGALAGGAAGLLGGAAISANGEENAIRKANDNTIRADLMNGMVPVPGSRAIPTRSSPMPGVGGDNTITNNITVNGGNALEVEQMFHKVLNTKLQDTNESFKLIKGR